jgi:cytochrome c biogenesis protein ResB
MEAGEALGTRDPRRRGWSRGFGLLNPLRAVWWLFTNVRFAIALLVVLSLAALVGTVLPQVPLNVRGDAAAEADWLATQRDRFGFMTGSMDRLELFDIFRARWFAMLLAVTVASTGAYVISRFAGTWAAITRPRKRVPDRYFEMARDRVTVEGKLDAERLEQALRRRRYKVERYQEGEAVHFFGDRFPWAQMGTLLTHAAVIVFILSAIVSRMDAFESHLFLAEGSSLPVFPVSDPNQMQVQLLNMHAAFAEDGRPLDYRSDLVVYQHGDEVLRCSSTVNSPCSYEGYRFYQAAYYGFGAGVQVRDLSTGNVIYRETLALTDRAFSPYVRIEDAGGSVLLDQQLLLPDYLTADEFAYFGTLVSLPGDRLLTVGLRQPAGGGEADLVVFEPGTGADAARLALGPGESGESAGLRISYVSEGTVPSLVVPDFPLPASAADGPQGEALLKLSNVVYGTETASEGTALDAPAAEGPPLLTLVGLRPQAVSLEPGASVTIDGYEYTFLGQREFSGLQVRRDRSDYLVWAGAAAMVVGLMVTFWVPRRRFWARISGNISAFAGQAPSHADYKREMRELAEEAGGGVPDVRDEDDE